MENLSLSATAPVRIAAVGLKARDARRLSAFYRDVVGLEEMPGRDGAAVLGAGGRPLLAIEEDAAAVPDDARQAGLFHIAFLLPSRADLARWARHALDLRVPLQGASDHLVSEAIYLADPEGNGIEIYADRPAARWPWEGGQIAMKTLPLDMDGLLATPRAERPWAGAPRGTIIGHVHLRVGDPAAAEAWWHEALGLDTMARYGRQAVFLASGGYHHHVGVNAWHSAGAGRRNPAMAGLAWVELQSDGAGQARTLQDPWGTVVRIAPAVQG
ncbi:VOC family protein [Chelativorans intermedius]|uniref:VOC family protein n=1 Tax=Chelativorans intermedius TaxID=515947 RepID=A0ABV6D3A3_9HYPH|nr:VOC family protein [Chelativorans intermedius]MCT8998390.1 VOC family protein [Chelativorans intermedius]